MASEDRTERIRRRAYQLWEQAGRPEGSGVDYWNEAEQEIEAEDRRNAATSEAAEPRTDERPMPGGIPRETTLQSDADRARDEVDRTYGAGDKPASAAPFAEAGGTTASRTAAPGSPEPDTGDRAARSHDGQAVGTEYSFRTKKPSPRKTSAEAPQRKGRKRASE